MLQIIWILVTWYKFPMNVYKRTLKILFVSTRRLGVDAREIFVANGKSIICVVTQQSYIMIKMLVLFV